MRKVLVVVTSLIVIIILIGYFYLIERSSQRQLQQYSRYSYTGVTSLPTTILSNFEYLKSGDAYVSIESCSSKEEEIDCITFDNTVLFKPDLSQLSEDKNIVEFEHKTLKFRYGIVAVEKLMMGQLVKGYHVYNLNDDDAYVVDFFYSKHKGILMFVRNFKFTDRISNKVVNYQNVKISASGYGIFESK